MNKKRISFLVILICYVCSFSLCQESFIKRPAKRKKISKSQLYEEIADAQATIIKDQADIMCYGATIQKHAVHIAQKVAHQEYAPNCSSKELELKRNTIKQIEHEIKVLKQKQADLHQQMIDLCK